MFNLRFDPSEIPLWAERYAYPRGEAELIAKASEVRATGRIDKPLL
jgi:hypothetical protein